MDENKKQDGTTMTAEESKQQEKEKFTTFVKVTAMALVIVIISELIGSQSIPLGSIGSITFLPIIWATFLGMIWGTKTVHVLKDEDIACARKFIVPGLLFLISVFGVGIGPKIDMVIAAGPALLLQELGNLFTLIAVPIGIWVGLGRQAVGAGFCLPREGGIAIIGDRYGMDSEEGRGVMGVYIVGTIFGALFYSVFAGISATYLGLHPFALAMASGMGSSGMMLGSIGTLTTMFPDMAAEIEAYSIASSTLTTVDGIWMSAFVGLPLANLIYKAVAKKPNKNKSEG